MPRDLQVMSLTRYCSAIPLNWSLEKCSHLRLLLFRQALGLSQLSRGKWCPGPGSNRHAEARGSQPTRVCLIPPPGRIGARRENRTLTLSRRQCLRLLRLPVPPDGQDGAAHRSRTCTEPAFKAGPSACWGTAAAPSARVERARLRLGYAAPLHRRGKWLAPRVGLEPTSSA